MRKEIVKTFFQFVQIDSPTGAELKFSNYLKARIRRLGFYVFQDRRGNLFISVKGSGKPVLFVAHLDTVEPGRGIRPVLEKGIIRSEGKTILGADNKATVSVLFEILRWSAKSDHRAFEVLFSIGEESGVPGVDTFDFSRVKSKTAFCFDMSQPVGTIGLSSPYYLSVDVEVLGKESDISSSKEGKTVIPPLIDFLRNSPQGFCDRETLCNFGVIKGGEARNAVLSKMEILGEIRSFDYRKLRHYSQALKKILQSVARLHDCEAHYSVKLENYGYRFKKTSSIIREISCYIKKAIPSGSVSYKERWWGISDANNINHKGIEAVNLGYGVKDAHTTQERIAVEDMLKVAEIIKAILSK